MTARRSAPGAGRRPSTLERKPLRVVLVSMMLALVIVGLLASGAAVTTVMRDQLLSRVDAGLREAAVGWAHRPPPARASEDGGATGDVGGTDGADGAGVPASPPGGPNQQRPPTQYYVAKFNAAGTVELVINDNGSAPDLRGVDPQTAGPDPFTVGSVPAEPTGAASVSESSASPDSWRVLIADGQDGTTVIALPLGDSVDHTVEQLIIVQTVAGVLVIILVGVLGALLVGRSMRPLQEVEAASADIAAGNLSRRLPERPEGTEVGNLTHSFNEMATRIEAAFAEVRSSEEAARQSEDRMRTFIADAGHELRTPLTSIRGFADLHASGAVPAEVALDRIGSESRRMTSLVEDLLTLAHLDALRPIDRKPVDVVTVVADSVRTIGGIAPERGIDVAVDSAPLVLGDAGRLEQAVLNLLVNAVRHTPATAGIRVTVDVDGQGEAGEAAVITVADEGPGMTAEETTRIFDRFTRLDASRTRGHGGGSGLGLSIAQGIARAHGGEITVVSEPGEGTAFSIRVPTADGARSERRDQPKMESTGAVGEHESGSREPPRKSRG